MGGEYFKQLCHVVLLRYGRSALGSLMQLGNTSLPLVMPSLQSLVIDFTYKDKVEDALEQDEAAEEMQQQQQHPADDPAADADEEDMGPEIVVDLLDDSSSDDDSGEDDNDVDPDDALRLAAGHNRRLLHSAVERWVAPRAAAVKHLRLM